MPGPNDCPRCGHPWGWHRSGWGISDAGATVPCRYMAADPDGAAPPAKCGCTRIPPYVGAGERITSGLRNLMVLAFAFGLVALGLWVSWQLR